MNDLSYLFAVFFAMMAVSFAERALPFVAGRWLKNQRWVRSLGDFLPLAIMVLLVVHSAVGAASSHQALPVAETLAIAVTFAVQWWLRNSLLSIFLGTALYLVLRNTTLPGLF